MPADAGDKKKKKGSRNAEVAASLRAFEATLRAACRRRGVAALKPLLCTLASCQDACAACENVLLAGSSVDGAMASAVAECLASYDAVTSLCFWGSRIGDEGLHAVACLLRGSGGKWWGGCRLSVVEVCADGRLGPWQPPQPPPPPPAEGDNGAQGTGERHAAPGAVAGAPGAASSAVAGGAVDIVGAREAVLPCLAQPGQEQQDGPQTLQPQRQQRPPCALPPPPPLGVCPPVPDALRLHLPAQLQLAEQAVSDRYGRPGAVRCRSAGPPLRPMAEVKKQQVAATLATWRQRRCAQDLLYPPQPLQQPDKRQTGGAAAAVAAAPAPVPPRLQAEACPRFSASALGDLGLALGVAGLKLVRLALDHTLLGSEGAVALAPGLGRCATLRQLSLCDCSIGPAGARALAAALAPAGSPPGAPDCSVTAGSCGLRQSVSGPASATTSASSRLSISTGGSGGGGGGGNGVVAGPLQGSRQPALQELMLSDNPLGAAGLQELAAAIRGMAALKVLGLSGIGVSEADTVQLQNLVHALAASPCQLEQLHFDNHVGEVAGHFLTLLPAKPSLLLLRLSARLAPEVVARLAELAADNIAAARPAPAKKRAGGAGGR